MESNTRECFCGSVCGLRNGLWPLRIVILRILKLVWKLRFRACDGGRCWATGVDVLPDEALLALKHFSFIPSNRRSR